MLNPRAVRFVCALAMAACLFWPAASNVIAQTETTAAISGQVTDESGAVLPGVSITATSPALQVREVNTVTDALGEYRFATLPIGTYSVKYSLQGFQSVTREGLRLTAGFTARIDLRMKVGALEETITVSGAAPVVDVSSTNTRTEFTRETLDVIPTSRNGAQSVLSQTPGVRSNLDIGGTSAGQVTNYFAFGQLGQPWAVVEGVLVAVPKANTQSGNYQDFSTMEEVQVRTMGNDAEVPTRGVYQSVVMKSGANTFHGGGYFSYTNGELQRGNLDAALKAQGITQSDRLVKRWDAQADYGGRLVRDRLWFYGSARKRDNVRNLVNWYKDDGSPGEAFTGQEFYTLKLSYQLSQQNRLVGFYQRNVKYNLHNIGQFFDWETRSKNTQPGHTNKIEWQGTLRTNAVASLQYGFWNWRGNRPASDVHRPPTYDIRTQKWAGASMDEMHVQGDFRHHARGSLSWFLADWFFGNHEFKSGFDYMLQGDVWDFFLREPSGNTDYSLVFDNGAPFQIITFNTPVSPKDRVAYTGLYVKDNWTIRRRLTLNLGLRFARDNLYIPEQSKVAGPFSEAAAFPRVPFKIYTSVSPRLHAAYDLTGDGRTVVKGGWGRFDLLRGEDQAEPVNANARTWTSYRWRDLNGNRTYEPGEVNLDPSGPDFVSRVTGTFAPTPGGAGALTGRITNPIEEQPKTDELFVSLERELLPNFGVRVSGIYSHNFNVPRLLFLGRPYEAFNIPINVRDPGPDGIPGNADDSGSITYYEYSRALSGAEFQRNTVVADPGGDETFKSIEVAATKRLSSRWQVMVAYSATKTNDPFVNNVGGGLDFQLSSFDPNAEIFTAQRTWEWLGKASGAYQFPWDITLAANYEHRSGNPWARTLLARGGVTIPSIVLNVEPIGTRRLPNVNLLDFRIAKVLRLSNHKLSAQIDFFNLLNVNPPTSVNSRSGATFARPNAIVPPMIALAGASYSF